MKETIARVLLITSRIFAGVATMVDKQTVQDETVKALNKMYPTMLHEVGHLDTLNNDDDWHIGQYL